MGEKWHENGVSRRVIALVLLLVGVLALGGVADAKKRKKKAKPGPVVTRSATSSVVGNGAIATATATCPAKMNAVGGGFFGTPATGVLGVPYESQKVGQNAWRTSSQAFGDGGIPDEVELTSLVYCRSRAPATTTAEATVLTPAALVPGPSATGTCASGRAVSGGFSTPPPAVGTSGLRNIIADSGPAGPGAWTARVISSSAGASSLTAYAYCTKKGKAPTAATATKLNFGDHNSFSSANASCTGKASPVAGGFSQPLSTGTLLFALSESRRDDTVWRVSGVRTGAGGTALPLGSVALCG